MGLGLIVLGILLVWLWLEVAGVQKNVRQVEDRLAKAGDEIRELTARLLRLEGRTTPEPVVAAAPASAPRPETVPVVPPAAVAVPPTPIVVQPAPQPAFATAASIPISPMPAPVKAGTEPPFPPPPLPPAVPPLPPPPPESWEMVVGTSWLNKIGVLVFIVGVALLVGYSFGHVGAAGRVAIGYAVSLGMLAGGVILERKETYRNYAYGLVAGGWAGTYFTTFAMHGIPAARIIDSDLSAVSLLMLVATGMIAHSLRYRSQVVTGLAFVVAYTTLSLSPLTGFALAASVPLAVALLFVSQRFGWSGVSAIGVVGTYGAFVIRHGVYPGGLMDPDSAMPFVTLGTYWLTFEVADIIGLRAHASEPKGTPAPVLALNAVGFMGSLLILLPANDPVRVSAWLFGAAGGYVVSAVLRAWLLPGWRARHSQPQAFDSSHTAMAIASALFAFAIGLRFRGNRAGLARLLEAQFLITSGLMLGDVWLRRIGSIAMAIAVVQAWLLGSVLGAGSHWFEWAPGTTSGVLLFVALACYASREAVQRRGEATEWVEDAYTWMALALVGMVIRFEFTPAHQALAGLVFAAVLLEVAFRRTSEYAWQSYAAGVLSGWAMLLAFLVEPPAGGALTGWGPAPTATDVWVVLPLATLIAAFGAWRLQSARSAAIPFAQPAAGVAATMAAAFLATFEWRALAPNAIAPTWALTGVALFALATWRHKPMLRWQATIFSAAAVIRAALPLTAFAPESSTQTLSVLVVIASVYVSCWLARRATEKSVPRFVLQALTASATMLLAMLEWRTVSAMQLGPSLAATGGVLLGIGLWRGIVDVRWHGHVLLTAGAFLASAVFGAVDPAPEAWVWLGAVIGLLYICGLVTGRALGGPKEDSLETLMPGVFLLGATGLLAGEIAREVRPSLVTLALGAQGLASMVVGLTARERLLRLSGLALLMTCILKLFVYDLRELEALARILSFVVLGLILLGISWAYTRYREQIRKFL